MRHYSESACNPPCQPPDGTGVTASAVYSHACKTRNALTLPPPSLRPAFVAVPLDLQTDLAISLLASTITLTPGISTDRKVLLVHALDVEDQDELVAVITQRYEKPLKEVFEAC